MSRFKLPKIANNNTYNIKNLNHLLLDKNQQELIKKAIEVGYLIYPSKEFIFKKYGNHLTTPISRISATESGSDAKSIEVKSSSRNKSAKMMDINLENYDLDKELEKILFLNLSNVPIIELGDVACCKNLRILNLSNNYLIEIDGLSECVHLMRLDLQNNQLNKLPGHEFWSKMKNLKMVFLHNNPIGKLEYLKYLSYSPCLEILTLYDSPISLKSNYRHHTVNSILTLKFLDEYVVSDEEIIEEANFNNKFSAKSENLRISLKLNPAPDNTFDSELRLSNGIIAKINAILAKYSPVLILQRHIRGFLARRRFVKTKKQMRINAATRIQQWWRKIRVNLQRKRRAIVDMTPKLTKSKSSVDTSIYFRAASSIESKDFIKNKLDNKRNNTPNSFYYKRNIIIDFNKLESNNLLFQQIDDVTRSKQKRKSKKPNKSFKANLLDKNESFLKAHDVNYANCRLINENRIGETFSQVVSIFNQKYASKHLAKNINDTNLDKIFAKRTGIKEIENADEINNGDETEIKFRLENFNNSIIKKKESYVVDLVKEKLYGYSSIRDLEDEAHALMAKAKVEANNKKNSDSDQLLTMDQRFFKKIYGNMNFSNLKAVDEAYHERDMSDKKAAVQKKVEHLRNLKSLSSRQIESFKNEYLKLNQNIKEKHEKEMRLAKEKAQEDFKLNKERVSNMRENNRNLNKNRRKDIMLAINFSKQHLSVSKALQRHEYFITKENDLKKNIDVVANQYHRYHKQHDVVKKYIEQRNLLRLVQTAADRQLVDTSIRRNMLVKLGEAKQRVDYLKSLEMKNLDRNMTLPSVNVLDNFDPDVEYDYDYLRRLQANSYLNSF